MTDQASFTLSVFVLEAARKVVLAIAAKTPAQAEQFCSDERVRALLQEACLCDDYSILRARTARKQERERYFGQRDLGSAIGGLHAVGPADR